MCRFDGGGGTSASSASSSPCTVAAATWSCRSASHLDRSTPVTGVGEPNGTPEWWRARGVAELVRLRTVATSYILGWDRSIAEIFAED